MKSLKVISFSLLFVFLMFSLPKAGLSQYKDSIVSIDDIEFRHVKFYSNGQIKEAGESYKNNKKNGFWIKFNRKGEELSFGKYSASVKVGKWWYRKREFYVYDDKGKIIRKGSGLRNEDF